MSALPTHDPNGRPLSDKARATLMALPEHMRHPAVISAANAPIDDRPEEDLRAEAALVAECDPSGPWIPHDVVTALLAIREREEGETAAE